jgi:hypothetical protein
VGLAPIAAQEHGYSSTAPITCCHAPLDALQRIVVNQPSIHQKPWMVQDARQDDNTPLLLNKFVGFDHPPSDIISLRPMLGSYFGVSCRPNRAPCSQIVIGQS